MQQSSHHGFDTSQQGYVLTCIDNGDVIQSKLEDKAKGQNL